MKAKIEIRIWSDDEQPDTEHLVEMFKSHAEHVANQLGKGNQAGEICGEGIRGWWEIVT